MHGCSCLIAGAYTGVIDNSGMRIYYTTEPSEFNAGSIALGHIVTPNMIVPPGVERFTIAGICSADCTQQVGTAIEMGRLFKLFYFVIGSPS